MFRSLVIVQILSIVVTFASAKGPDQARPMAKLEANIARMFRDPDSVKLDSIEIITTGPQDQSVCGYANAKNGYGGYAGRNLFHITVRSGVMEKMDIADNARFPENQSIAYEKCNNARLMRDH
jgi:hypothetical protein